MTTKHIRKLTFSEYSTRYKAGVLLTNIGVVLLGVWFLTGLVYVVVLVSRESVFNALVTAGLFATFALLGVGWKLKE